MNEAKFKRKCDTCGKYFLVFAGLGINRANCNRCRPSIS